MQSADRKIVLVVRETRLDELTARFNTVQQARFYVEHLGADFGDFGVAAAPVVADDVADDVFRDFPTGQGTFGVSPIAFGLRERLSGTA